MLTMITVVINVGLWLPGNDRSVLCWETVLTVLSSLLSPPVPAVVELWSWRVSG